MPLCPGPPLGACSVCVDLRRDCVQKRDMRRRLPTAWHSMQNRSVRLGSNLMMFSLRLSIADRCPHLDRLGPSDLNPPLSKSWSCYRRGPNQYRLFLRLTRRAIKACFIFLREDASYSADFACGRASGAWQIVQSLCVLMPRFVSIARRCPRRSQRSLKPESSAACVCSYTLLMPAVAQDPSHALRHVADR